MADLFSIPFKRTLQFSLKDAISQVIDSKFYQTAASVTNDLILLEKYRDILSHLDVSIQDLQELIKYYLSLKAISVKLPDDQIEFTWFNTLGLKSSGLTRNSLKFEILNVLYNIGAMYSLLSVSNNLSSNDGLKESCRLFKLAAGCFQRIYDEEVKTGFTFFDENTLQSLIHLMLAEAQEMVWKKAYFDDKERHSILSRLALQVSIFYEDASRYANRSPLIRTDWIKGMTFKSKYYTAVSYYRSALLQIEKQNFAQAICDLTHALSILKKMTLNDSLVEWKIDMQNLLETTERDNDLIYLQASVQKVSPIKPAVIVQPEFFKEIDMKDNEMFKNLLPVDVIESCSAFSERVENYVNENITNPLKAMNKILLENISFSGVFESMYITEQEWDSYEASLKDLNEIRNYITSKLKSLRNTINHEIDENEEMIRKHGQIRWKVESIDDGIRGYLSDLERIENYALDGQRIDTETEHLFGTLDHDLVTNVTKAPESNNPVLKEVFSLLKQRKEYIRVAERKIIENKLLPKIISYYKKTGSIDFEPVYQEYIRVFDEDLNTVQKEKAKNIEILSQISNGVQQQAKVSRVDPLTLYMEELKHSSRILSEVKQNITSGKKFYDDLVKAIQAKEERINDYIIKRKNEREIMDRVLEEKMG